MCESIMNRVVFWAAALLMALGLSVIPTSCTPMPMPVSAEAEVAQLAEVYEQMSDAERMRGVVLEP